MKKKTWLFLLAGICCYQWSSAQVESDALRYSFLTPGGTARMQAIGGSGASLGGDPSLMTVNPAAIGLFKTSDFSITPGIKTVLNNGNYLNESASDNKTNFYIQQMALILATNSRHRNPDSKWKNVTVGIGLNRLANFNQNIFYQGNNNVSSYSDQYLIQLAKDGYTGVDIHNFISDAVENGWYPSSQPSSSLYPNGIFQAYETYLIDPNQDNNGSYWTSLPSYILGRKKKLLQSNSISTKGGLNEFNLAVAGNYNDRLYIGISLNIPSINYDKTSTFRETNNNSDTTYFLKYYEVTDRVHTDGVGINGKIGIIYALQPNLRIGASFHSPTYYSMHDTYSTTMTTSTTDQGTVTINSSDYAIQKSDYSMTTPWRAIGGISYIIGATPDAAHHGFISLDYEYVNYSASRFHFNGSNSTASDKEYADELNNSISDIYKGASNIRLGGEIKFNLFALRAGVAYMGSPYSEDETQRVKEETGTDINGDQMQYSLGLGYRNRGFYADLTYVYTQKGDRYNQPYLVDANSANIPSPAPAIIDGHRGNILLTLGFTL